MQCVWSWGNVPTHFMNHKCHLSGRDMVTVVFSDSSWRLKIVLHHPAYQRATQAVRWF